MPAKKGKSLGELIKEELKAREINGSAVARKMGLARQIINQIDRRKSFDLEFLQKLKAASGLDFTSYVFEPKSNSYVDISQLTTVAEPSTPYPSGKNSVTLNFMVSCDRDRVSEFSKFLNDVDKIANNYGYKIV